MEQPDRNNTNFPIWNYQKLKSSKWVANDVEMYHQYLVRTYLLNNPKIRGVLVYHGVGWGKTRLGANTVREYVNERQIVVIAPKKVFPKFQQEFQLVGVDSNNINYISLKASNLTAQVDRLPSTEIDVLRNTPLDNTFLIIDEAHNFFNAIVNGGKNAVDLYDSIMTAKNIKILFLTGTPIINTPFELVPCFNMLTGHKLFPENPEDFDKYFIRDEHVKNADRFKNRIFGLVSYFGDWVQAVSREYRPQRLPTQIIKVQMSEQQYAIYSGYRDKEREERGSQGRANNERFAPKTSSSSYRIRSRQASNFTPTDAADRGITVPANCPKFYKMLEIVKSHAGQPGIVCSNFVNHSGLLDFAALLMQQGWEQWHDQTTRGRRFAVITGGIDEDEAADIQKQASAANNHQGGIIQLVLVGPAGAEGIEFKNFRYCIIMDPFFNAVRSDQFEGRIDRYASHAALPVAQRVVQTYHMLAVYPENVNPKDRAKEPTTDEHLYVQSKRRKLLSLEFYKLMIEASIDCKLHSEKLSKDRAKKIHCMMCSPTNTPLFTNRLDMDIKNANPCQPPVLETIKAKEIIVETETGPAKYMYVKTRDLYEFFEYRQELAGYIPMARNHRHYDLLMETLA